MPATLHLSSGFKVLLGECYTHGMHRAFNEELVKGMQLKQKDGQVVVEDIQPDAMDRAAEVVLARLVERIEKAGQDVTFSSEWLAMLPEKDFVLLKEYVERLRTESATSEEAGKKND